MSMKHGSKRASARSSRGQIQEPQGVAQAPIRDPRVQIVIDFMNANCQRNVSLTDLAEAADLSTSHVSYLFNIETGHSPGEYLRRLRMGKARHLLTTSLLRVKQIMAIVGYNSKGHFARDFRRSFGLAPSEYRKSLQKGKRRFRSAKS
jgi:AraC family transcriptional regulator